MDREHAAATAGVVASLLTAGAVAAPYLLLPAGQLDNVAAYYGTGVVTPLAPGLLGLLGAIIFAAGREGRSDPDLVAGIALAIGVFSLLVGLEWALAFRPGVFGGGVAIEFLDGHRWSVPTGGLLETAAAVWYAGTRGLVSLPAPVTG